MCWSFGLQEQGGMCIWLKSVILLWNICFLAILQISIIYALRLVLVSQMTSTLFFIQKKIKKFNMYFCKLTFSEFNIFPKNYCCHNSWQRDNYIGKITIFKWYKKSFHILMVAIIFLPTISLNTSYISNSYRRNLLI